MQTVLLSELDRCSLISYRYDVHDQLRQYICARSQQAFAAGDAARDRIGSPEELRQHQQRIRRVFLNGCGNLPASPTSLEAVITGRAENASYVVEKIIFQSRPHHYVTANFYLPYSLSGPCAAVLLLCGHDPGGKQDYGKLAGILANSGLIVFVQDPLGQGERLGYFDSSLSPACAMRGTVEHDYAGAQCLPLGDGIARYFLHDAMRSIDYLISRPEVDEKKIGVTGASGGGTQTLMLMMTEPRIAAAAPGCFVTSRAAYQQTGQAQDAEQIWFGFSGAGFDHADALLAMAPRPVLVLSTLSDFFPIEGTRDSVEKARRTLQRASASGAIETYEEPSPHGYTEGMARAAAEFFNHRLMKRSCTPATDVESLPPEKLICTSSGQVASEYSNAQFVHAANGERVPKLRTQRASLTPEQVLSWLHERVFFERADCALNPRYFHAAVFEELRLDFVHWWSQPQLLNHGVLIRRASAMEAPRVTLAIWDGGTAQLSRHLDWIRGVLTSAGNAVFVVDLSGCGAITPRPINPHSLDEFYGTMHKFCCDLRWLGDDLAALRIYEVLRAAEMLRQWDGIDVQELKLYGQGLHGLYAQLAAALEPRFQLVQIEGGLKSYEELVLSRHYSTRDIHSVLLHGVLKYFDLLDLVRTNIKD
jgi:cephalosporin-C deacetylase-like acetyl esterase